MEGTFSCQPLKSHEKTKARVTKVTTPHGTFLTPAFMPVGTRAGVNNLTPQELITTGSQIILGGNTYHMLCAPGMDIIRAAKGMHAFMGWQGPMLTDSGGFQVFSLSKNKTICTIDEVGAHFKVPNTTSMISLTPKTSLEAQKTIGADIIMAFDQCTPDHASPSEAEAIMRRTHRWLEESVEYHHRHPNSCYGNTQALFGIIQGGLYKELRQESAAYIASMNTEGIAIGGETIGFNMPLTRDVIQWVYPWLPDHKLRYTMGVGLSPQDLLDVVVEGIDIFDCVAPTRNARHGALYVGQVVPDGHWIKFDSPYPNARLQIKKACFAQDPNPIMDDCKCYTCQTYSRSYLHHLFKQHLPLFTALASIHNVHVMQDVCVQMRAFILQS